MKRLILFVLIFLTASQTAFADTSIWKVQSDKSVLYLGGTVHLLRQSDYPLPVEYDKAYEKAALLVFEADIADLYKPETQQLLVSKGLYRDGTSLETVLSPEAYGALKKYCESAGIPVLSFNKFKPSMVMLTLLGQELQKMGIGKSGVEEYYFRKANADKKPVKGLENIDEHIELITSMGKGNESNFILHSIKDLKEAERIINALIDGWREGDEKKLYELFIKEMKDEFPNLYKTLLVDRNRKWLPQIEDYLQTPETELVLVGAAHLIGPDGVIASLKNKGYKLEKLK
ncbi:MAG: TraB/GumN family protein [Proteobacteria bacterium]|nr:TraB/GumN family protein [Pseudomonadota bacterium]